ncbi:probably inactive leucine-rich repeat receptor-like protein kinase IMK2 [Lycium ferocissimum]|uniref:probably inactive leucine-rich repeat receptor-like protein kinase IMK2 n=1 Tax=Lycium ferocissimum TaxID=112874 RepID=UPI0028153357|nr:probably inactive leucine-rich repeat receptor-like protein kinase IMK2 [Lycium ferocissimum]
MEDQDFSCFYSHPFVFFKFLTPKEAGRHICCDKKKEKGIPFVQIFLFLQLIFSRTQLALGQDNWDGIIITEANFQALEALKHELVDPKGYLKSWNNSNGACSGSWIGIKCAQGQVIVIKLPLKGLSGRLTEKIGQLQGLRKLSLHDNDIGGLVPTSLGFLPNLRGVQLYNNRFSGSIPGSLGLCPLLQTLELSNNSLSGTIPTSLVNSTKLYRLNLSHNSLSGTIPQSFTQSPSLIFLDLQYNNLSGSIPDSWGGKLQSLTLDHNFFSGGIPVSLGKLNELLEISLSHNHITGVIPNEIGKLAMLRTLDLSYNAINGSLPESFSNLSSLVVVNLESNNLDGEIPLDINKVRKLSVLNLRDNQFRGVVPATIGYISALSQIDLSHNNLTGEIPVSVDDLPNLKSFNVSYNSLSGPVPTHLAKEFNSSAFLGNTQLCGYNTSNPCPVTPSAGGSKRSIKDVIILIVGSLIIIVFLVCCILLCCLIKKRAEAKAANDVKDVPPTVGEVETAGDNTGGKLVHFGGGMMFSADDLLCATADILGKSTYGTVYKTTLEDGNQVAVKRLREKITKGQREFEKEVNVLGKIRHPNLLALRAYYLGTKGEKLLIFDYMPNGSLATFLHARGPDTPVDWPKRMRIAKGTTRGLLYLHTNVNIIHGNLTSSNVLLDENTDAKIADYGLSRLVTAAANSNVIATAGVLGYRAPELNKLKKANVKTDVYSLGVIILEILTGKSPGEVTNGVDLPKRVASIVKEEGTNEVFDLELMRDASIFGDEMLSALKLALHCVDPSPSARPEVQQVLQQLEDIRREMPTAGPSASH